MVVQTTKSPNLNDLIQVLKSQFTNYSVYAFGSKPHPSIIVRKSAIVGVQITVRENEILVDACYPNIVISSVMSLLTASSIFPFNSWHSFEKKITGCLKISYK